MNCEQIIETIQAALDKGREVRLPDDARHHLESCRSCRRFREELIALESGLGALAQREEAAPPARLHASIMTALEREKARPVSWHRPLARFALAAASMVAAFALYHGLTEKSPPRLSRKTAETTLPLPTLSLAEAKLDPMALIGDSDRDIGEATVSFGASVAGLLRSIEPPNKPAANAPPPG